MKFLLALTFLLAFLALALTEPDTDKDLELLRDQLEVRDKREPAMQRKKGEGENKKNAVIKKDASLASNNGLQPVGVMHLLCTSAF